MRTTSETSPKLSALGCPNPGQILTLRIREGDGGQPAFLAVGTGAGTTPLLGGCALFVSPLLSVSPRGILFDFGPGWGYRDVPLPVPPSGAGLAFTFQAAHLDPGAPAGFAVSNGLRIEIE